MSGFEGLYRDGVAPWDIGRPQTEVVRLEEAGRIEGSVLDLGCGTGENALYLAERGHPVVGIDGAPTALSRAREKATKRRLGVMFQLGDALDLDSRLGSFRSFLDSGFFHTLSDAQRPAYVASLGRVAHAGARLFILSFSDHQPPGPGPRRLHESEFASTFAPSWRVVAVHPGYFDTVDGPKAIRAWVAELRRA